MEEKTLFLTATFAAATLMAGFAWRQNTDFISQEPPATVGFASLLQCNRPALGNGGAERLVLPGSGGKETPPASTSPSRREDIELLARTVYGEARGLCAEEQRLVVWTVFQRVDAGAYGDTVAEVVTKPNQFAGYDPAHPVTDEIFALCAEELDKWERGEQPPTLEPYATGTPYYFFSGGHFDKDGVAHNYFRENW